jgi:hypothetical protein
VTATLNASKKGIAMHTSSRLCLLVALALGSTLSHGADSTPLLAPVMVNPQPLPPRHPGVATHESVNPQPLPPKDRKATASPDGDAGLLLALRQTWLSHSA